MSGSGGGPFDFGIPKRDCKSVSSRAIINSPDATNISLLEIGSILNLSLQTNRGPILAYYKNNLLGSVLAASLADIIECMDSGTSFQGKVIVLNGAHCEILITAI